MKLLSLLHYVTHDVIISVSQVDEHGDNRIVYEGKKEDLMDYIIDNCSSDENPNDIFGIRIVNVDVDTYYFDPYDLLSEGEPRLCLTVTGWKERG